MIVATMITYNDWPLVKQAVESVIDKVDQMIIVDGRYRDFPGKHFLSTDGTKEYLDSINGGKIRVVYAANFDEVGKRNIYLSRIRDGDTVLNIDTDEVLITDIPELESDIGIIRIGEDGDRRRHRRTIRFFRYHDGLHYWGQHKLILDKNNKVFAWLNRVGSNYSVQDTKVEFLHNNHKRSYNRIKDKNQYYKILLKREAKIDVSIT